MPLQLLSIIPKPTKAVVLLFPANSGIQAKRKEQDEKIAAEGQHPIDQTLFFVKQKVQNACGTIALVHAIANSDVTYVPDSPLQRFISMCKDKSPEERGDLMLSTDLFTKIHLDSSALGQTSQPTSEEDGMNTDLHFTCFVAAPDGDVRKAAAERQHTMQVGGSAPREASSATTTTAPQSTSESSGLGPGDVVMSAPSQPIGKVTASGVPPTEGLLEGMRLIELDGRKPCPVDHGPCVDVLDDAITVIKKYYLSQVETVYFSLMAFGAAPPANSPFN